MISTLSRAREYLSDTYTQQSVVQIVCAIYEVSYKREKIQERTTTHSCFMVYGDLCMCNSDDLQSEDIIIIKMDVVIATLVQTLTIRASASSPPKPVDCIPGVCGSSASSVHSARKRAHTARNALTEPFSCTSVMVHPLPQLPL